MATQKRTLHFFLSCLLGVLVSTTSPSAGSPPHSDLADALWIAESDRGLKVALSDGRVLFEIPDTGRIEALILNEEGAVLWAYGEGRLSAYDFSGRRLLNRPIAFKRTDQACGPKRARLALNPLDGSLWLGVGRRLYHFDPSGEVLQEIELPDPIRALSFDRTRTQLWVGFRRSLTAYDASGTPGQRIEIGRSGKLRDLAYDETLDGLWVVLKDQRVRRYAPEGGEVQVDAHLSEAPRRLAPDHQGGAWIAAGKHLLRVDGRGSERLKLRPFAGAEQDGTRIEALAVEPREGAVWIASRGTVREVDASGELKPLLALGADRPKLDLRALAVYTDGIPPTVAITSPPEGHVVPMDRPLFAVSYENRGIGIDEPTLQWTANGNPLAVSCEARAEGATCTPIAGLPEGLNTLQTSIADLHGNRGQSAEIPFTVDTRPPEITLDVPPEWITNQAEQTLSGRISEVVTLTLDGSALALPPDLSFRHRLTLSEGPHLYTFRASDAAGHTGTATTRVTLDTLAPPAPEASLVSFGHPEGGVVTVTGGPDSVEPFGRVTITNPRTGESITVTSESDGSFSTVIAAEAGDVLHIEATDAAGNHSEHRPFTVQAPGGDLPPDPATVAPPPSTRPGSRPCTRRPPSSISAGKGTSGFSGDGGPATQAGLTKESCGCCRRGGRRSVYRGSL